MIVDVDTPCQQVFTGIPPVPCRINSPIPPAMLFGVSDLDVLLIDHGISCRIGTMQRALIRSTIGLLESQGSSSCESFPTPRTHQGSIATCRFYMVVIFRAINSQVIIYLFNKFGKQN